LDEPATKALPDAPPLGRRIAAEGIGSFFLFACVIGSGIMAEHLSGGNDAVALLENTLATGAMLFVLIPMLGPISGAHRVEICAAGLADAVSVEPDHRKQKLGSVTRDCIQLQAIAGRQRSEVANDAVWRYPFQ
jgi:hypothetical protein